MGLNLELEDEVRAAVVAVIPELRAAVAEAVERAMNDRMFTVEEAAETFGCSVAALRKKVARGHIRVHRIGRAVRIRSVDLLGASRD
jgi:excisionase family DNA binding protein